MDPVSASWWMQVVASSSMLVLANVGPFGGVAMVMLVYALMSSPAGSTLVWFGESIGRTPGKALLAVASMLAVPFALAFVMGAAMETPEAPDTPLLEGVSVGLAAVIGIVLTSAAPEWATAPLMAAVLIPFVYFGLQTGTAFRAAIDSGSSEPIDGLRVAVSVAVLLVVLMASVLRGRVSMKFSGQSMVSDIMSRNTLPPLA